MTMMKKVVWAVAMCCTLFLAAVPAMAVELEVSGHYFLEHYSHSNETLRKDDATNDYSSMELMVKPVLTINENITLTGQFTALEDHVWGTDASGQSDGGTVLAPKMDNKDNFDWKAAYMTVKTPIGGFVAGRFIDTPWGCTGLGDTTAAHGNNDYHKDRIMYILPIGNTISGLVIQKNSEGDKGHEFSNKDFHKYYGVTSYNAENWSTGILISNYQHKNFTTDRDLRMFQRNYTDFQTATNAYNVASATFGGYYAATVAAAGGGATGAAYAAAQLRDPTSTLYNLSMSADAAQARATYAGSLVSGGPTRSKMNLWVFDPYYTGTFGGLAIDAELLYGIGTIKLRDIYVDQGLYIDPRTGKSYDEIDAEGLAATLDLNYTLSRWTFNAGFTYVQGDSNYLDDEINALGYLEPSVDLEHGFLLTSDVSDLHTTLGGTDQYGVPVGNVAGGPTTLTGSAGYRMFWVGAKYKVLDNLEVGALCVKSRADDAPYVDIYDTTNSKRWDDDHGIEYDLTVKWDIMDNLTFNGVVAYLDAGDYWKQGDPNRKIDDNLTFYGQLLVTF